MQDYRERRPNDCCKKSENYSVEVGLAQQPFEVCKVCGCRHWVIHVETANTGLKGVSLGGIRQNKN